MPSSATPFRFRQAGGSYSLIEDGKCDPAIAMPELGRQGIQAYRSDRIRSRLDQQSAWNSLKKAPGADTTPGVIELQS